MHHGGHRRYKCLAIELATAWPTYRTLTSVYSTRLAHSTIRSSLDCTWGTDDCVRASLKTCLLYSNQANILLSGAHLNGQELAWTGTLSCLHCAIRGGNGRATAWPAFRTLWQGYRSTLYCWELTRMLLLLYGTAWLRRIKTNSCCMHVIPQRPSCL